VTQYQITYWREIPSMVVARDEQGTVKALFSSRFQEAIDEVAMRLDDISSDNYLAAWTQGPWLDSVDSANETAQRISAEIENDFTESKLSALVDELGNPT
jgi:hypothetical protein